MLWRNSTWWKGADHARHHCRRPSKTCRRYSLGRRCPNGIAAFLGISARRCYYLIESGALPVNKLGHRTIVGYRAASSVASSDALQIHDQKKEAPGPDPAGEEISLIDSISSDDENSQSQVRSADASAQVPPVRTSLVRYGTARRALAEAPPRRRSPNGITQGITCRGIPRGTNLASHRDPRTEPSPAHFDDEISFN
jgi:hypothetical protein